MRPTAPVAGLALGLLCLSWTPPTRAMTAAALAALRHETRHVFYHGFDNYMQHAFPDDELRPLTCAPLTRDRQNAAHIEVNDVLGNYSLTLVDSLSTLAILASSPPAPPPARNRALDDFQEGIADLVRHYGDGSPGPRGRGLRTRGFDLDSKVQVFETVIRGVGGLVSAHQFAVGDLPIRGYRATPGQAWPNGFVYDGQLLRLAADLADRLLPAFDTPTGLPYPRVNLRHGVPFYSRSPHNSDSAPDQCPKDSRVEPAEITETCSAGAGSLVLELATLSRLTGNPRYERAAKAAFWAVWQRRSQIGLVGAGIDAETGQWVSSHTGIGAGIDSFFEYALKTHILLSGLPHDLVHANTDSSDAFLAAWYSAHADIRRHIYRGAPHHHPHYAQVDMQTGALRAFWIDSLSAFYPGLLTMAGQLDEATETHLLYTALWARYAALPERWSTTTGDIEHGLHWWGGRPEWIESTWYLYHATKDPWYLYAGEMALRDIKRRCWTKCGWAGLQNVHTGELSDRMESFFLGETAKYLFLLFDPSHPLNTWDAPFVFTTEGHPLIIPKRVRPSTARYKTRPPAGTQSPPRPGICPQPPAHLPFSISATAARADVFHAANLARLHLRPAQETLQSPIVEFNGNHPSISLSDVQSPSNHTYYPWTLPPTLVPYNATSSPISVHATFDLSFPSMPDLVVKSALQRVQSGILVNSMSGLRLGMVREQHQPADIGRPITLDEYFRVYAISNIALGRDEKIYLSRATIDRFNPLDPFFTRTSDPQNLDLVVDVPLLPTPASRALSALLQGDLGSLGNISDPGLERKADAENADNASSYLSNLLSSFQALLAAPDPTMASGHLKPPRAPQPTLRHSIAAALPVGPGAVPLPETSDPKADYSEDDPLVWSTIYIHPNSLCDERLPIDIPKQYQIIVIPRGGCSFSTKLRNIVAYPPDSASLQIVVVVSFPEFEEARKTNADDTTGPSHPETQSSGSLVQPLLDEAQYTPSGLPRPHPIPLIMVSGGEETMALLRRAHRVGVRRRYFFRSQGVKIDNLIVL